MNVTASSENGVLTFDGGTHSHCIAKREDKCGVESRKFYLVCKTALERLDLPLCSNPMKKILVLNASSHRTCTAGLNSVKVWDLIGGGKMVCFMESHNKTVMSMCVGRMGLDENRLVIVSLDGYMKVFDYGRAKLTYSMRFQAPLLSVALSPDCSIRVINSMVFAGKKKLRNDAEKKQTMTLTIKTNWEVGDECRVWWRNESSEGGAWWEGRIESSQVKSPNFPDSPWERYKVVYETGDTNLHSPWEFDNPQFPWENSTMDEEPREKLLSLFAGLVKSISKHQDSYGIQKLNEAAQKMDFCNGFPVPLYPELIHQRVENRYYRSMGSFKHDVDAMLSNAESYFGTNSHMRSKIKRLRDKITKTLRKVSHSC
ncbi:hypothetical protein HID58_063584 [Brassica napus]|uniref:Bromo domain-containing protein n=1 Tax=Brassica napus TaxID=3708 RepID=A0ABQ8A4Z8_BRANA|nr:hypothetical protein HID58_063584 [Brassica napus]